MAINIYIVGKGKRPKVEDYLKQKSIDIQDNRAVFYHLNLMWEEIREKTGVEISDIEDIFFEENLLQILFEVVSLELQKAKDIQADSWIFNIGTSYEKQINNNSNQSDSLELTKSYLTEFFIKSYHYEVLSAINENVKISALKDWKEIRKVDLINFLQAFLAKINDAIEMDMRLHFSYS